MHSPIRSAALCLHAVSTITSSPPHARTVRAAAFVCVRLGRSCAQGIEARRAETRNDTRSAGLGSREPDRRHWRRVRPVIGPALFSGRVEVGTNDVYRLSARAWLLARTKRFFVEGGAVDWKWLMELPGISVAVIVVVLLLVPPISVYLWRHALNKKLPPLPAPFPDGSGRTSEHAPEPILERREPGGPAGQGNQPAKEQVVDPFEEYDRAVDVLTAMGVTDGEHSRSLVEEAEDAKGRG